MTFSKKRQLRQRRRSFSVENLESRRLLAQMVVGSASQDDANVGDQITIAADYSTAPPEETGGVSVRLHYNPVLVDFDVANLSYPADGPQPQGSPFIADDSGDFDQDSTTTKYVQLDFADSSLNFPESLSPLFNAVFTTIAEGTANFNYTLPFGAAGDTTTSASVTIAEATTTPPTQTVTADPISQSVQVNDDFTISTNYATMPASETGGVSIRLHYNPALVSFDVGDLSYPTGGPTPQGTPFIANDTSDADSDPTTTSFVQIDFADSNLMFPETLTPLFNAIFTASAEGTANFNYTFNDAIGTPDSTSASVTITEPTTEPPTQTVTADPISQDVQVDDDFTISTNYATMPASETGGVSIRLHYNPALVSFDVGDLSYPTGGPTPQGTPFVANDTNNADSDPTTTSFVQIDYADSNLTFPETLTPLFSALFMATGEGTANFNYTFNNAIGTPSSTSATVTIDAEDVVLPTVNVSPANQSGTEDSGTLTFGFNLSSASASDVTVPFTLSGTADNGSDYTISSSPITITAGQTSATLAINVINDSDVENDETVIVTLGNPTGADLGSSFAHTLTILDDDPVVSEPVISLNLSGQTVSESAGNITFTMQLSESTNEEVSIPFSLSGSASDDDYAFSASPIVIPAGQTTGTFSVSIVDDGRNEFDETIVISFGQPSGAMIAANASFVITIQDDDQPQRPTRILVPNLVAGPHVIPGDGIPTAIIFRATAAATVTATPIGSASASERVRILDGGLVKASEFVEGVTTAEVNAGELYAIIFESQTTDRVYSIYSSAGYRALSKAGFTNIINPFDTNADGRTSALDALVVVNRMTQLTSAAEGESNSNFGGYYDVNADGRITALDALLVINAMSRRSTGGEGERDQVSWGSVRSEADNDLNEHSEEAKLLEDFSLPRIANENSLGASTAFPSREQVLNPHAMADRAISELFAEGSEGFGDLASTEIVV